jgi:hypothetical protein
MLGSGTGEGVCRCAATVPDFHRVRTGRETENLKNWISDTQITGPTRQDFRISEFQVFTAPRMHGPGGGDGGFRMAAFGVPIQPVDATSRRKIVA